MLFQDQVNDMLEDTPMQFATKRHIKVATVCSAHMTLDAQRDALKEKLGRSAFTDDYTREERIQMRARLSDMSVMHPITESPKLA